MTNSSEGGRESYLSLVLTSLHYRNFRLFWLGSLTEHFGEFMEIAAILWLVNEMTHSPLMLTIVGSSRFMSMIIFPVVGGIAADRVNRRSLLIAALLGSSLLSICLVALVITGVIAVWHLIAIGLLGGVAMSFNHPARQAILPNLVKREHLLNAVSLDSLSVHGARMVGMLAGGYLIATVGLWPIFVIRTLGCLLAILWLSFAQVPATPPTTRELAPWRNLAEGFHYMRGNMTILALLVLYLVPWLAMNTYSNFLPVFASDILRVGAVGYGYLQAAPGLGAIVSLIGLTLLTYYKRRFKLLVGFGIILGIGILGFSVSPWFILSLLLLVVIGGTLNSFAAVNTTLIQGLVPDKMRGRMMGWREVAFGLGPTGSILFGAIARYTGVPFSLTLLGSTCLIISLLLILLAKKYSNESKL